MGSNSSSPSSKKKKKSALLNRKRQNTIPNKQEEDDWILECIVEYIQSTECSIYVDGFIDEHCLVFESDTNDSEILYEYQQIHSQYKEMIEKVLLSRLSKLGLTAQQFTDAMNKAHEANLDGRIMQYITAIQDFSVFKNIMIHRNIMLEQEAIKYLSANAQNASNQPVDINRMSEEEQLAWALAESISTAIQQPQPPALSVPEPDEPIPSAPSMNSDEMLIPKQNSDIGEIEGQNNNNNNNNNNDPFDMIANINMSLPKRVSLKPIKLQKSENASFEGIDKMDQALPTLTAASIQNIKLKQSANQNPLVLRQKQMILSMRKQKRNKEMKTMLPEGPGWSTDSLRASSQSVLPPLHKSLFAKMTQNEGDQ